MYKVVEQKHKLFLSGRMSADDLDKLINKCASGSWTLNRIIAGETARFIGLGEETER